MGEIMPIKFEDVLVIGQIRKRKNTEKSIEKAAIKYCKYSDDLNIIELNSLKSAFENMQRNLIIFHNEPQHMRINNHFII